MKPTLVLIPGLLSDGIVWRRAVESISTVLPVAVADLSTQDHITRMAEDTLSAHPGPLYLAGHSMGARVALEMVRLAPDRIERLALCDTGIHPRKEGEEARRQVLVELAYREGMKALADQWLPPMVHSARHTDRVLMSELCAMVERMSPELHERQIRALLDRPDARPSLQDIRCPTLLLVGRQDAWSPLAQHEEMQSLLPHARLEVIEDAGHFAPIERPEAVGAALENWIRA
ncbi:alpha/beta fold hydrolase [Chelativorans sp. J32]|uniref:alpha/beta fold hydrolase n=1 Tax=Chelativorans sp. J32 TaxID=935840 RepID=UPI000487FFD4|nr:alpha/beta hydrolase [Chelativorans sp. J32]